MQGQSFIRKVCSFGSKFTGVGKFCYIAVSYDSTSINEIHDSSITYCNQGKLDGFNSIYLGYGSNSFFQNNITRNHCEDNTAFVIAYGEGIISIKYSIIDENYANSRICFTKSKPTTYDSIVFTNNTISKNDNSFPGMLHCQSSHVTFENCFIENNKQNGCYLFGTLDDLDSITVSNSYIDSREKLYLESQQVTIEQNKDISIELHLHSTELCPTGNNYFVYINKGNKFISGFIHLKGIGESMTSFFS
ncbi:hypothetical protein TVAG_437090 [Trichomonas vaginalis G3]|uniref:Right handed beta helix domain-containing protein n=1 Tax=Trichomonas vaginalis (strain ATCC PRA-98 / G3) TaxID=412133 RepID=A2DFF6_TRIV3|nr:hypothetical protein TVAGG3_0565020 [Trichomonas vaginalis G3]EAY20884.1 hypothetical protein TVAG_437090 [Trichomonas vaginalis G3]KAI5521506.1 hypothetical protein TVAGG3_0565020 [Trichomonas vaginalis G3]|eukprot:XP_001581870.1 hypothetical protein [Trichomonas vaginalis G3]